jgi:hypothetical protein
MKLNWGTGIAIFYGVFVFFLAFQLVRSTQYDRSLVVDDYYAKDLLYQEHFDRLVNARDLGQAVRFKQDAGQLEIAFPASHDSPVGQVWFYKPDAVQLDHILEIRTNENRSMLTDISSLHKGLWKVKVTWSEGGVDYFDEGKITIK